MARVRLSIAARHDLDDVQASGLAQFGVDATLAHLEAIERIFALLREHPHAGQAQPGYGDGMRSFAVRPHRLLYRVDEDVVLIVRILHGAQHVSPATLGRHD